MKLSTTLILIALAYFFCSNFAIGLGRKIEAAQKVEITKIEKALAEVE